MYDFTFAVMSYNQENCIVETLESIKYQITQYGANMKIRLILVDDASQDQTADIISYWLENNQIFYKCEFYKNEVNCGTVKNYLMIMSLIGDEHFKVIAGDDLISSNNLFDSYLKLQEDEIRCGFKIYLQDGRIFYSQYDLTKFFYYYKKALQGEKRLRAFRRGGYFHTPSVIYSKKLFDESECEKLVNNFYLFEDDPTWYSMLKKNSNLSVDFIPNIIVLYRIHNKSVSNSPNLLFEKDLHKLFNIYIGEAGYWERIDIKSKIRAKSTYFSYYRFVDRVETIKFYLFAIMHKEYYLLKNKMEVEIKKEQEYYDSIKNNMSIKQDSM